MSNTVQPKITTVLEFLNEAAKTLDAIKELGRDAQDKIDACEISDINQEILNGFTQHLTDFQATADKVKAAALPWEKELIDSACKDVHERFAQAKSTLPLKQIETSNELAKQVKDVKKSFAKLTRQPGSVDCEPLRTRIVTLISRMPAKARADLYHMERNLTQMKGMPLQESLSRLLQSLNRTDLATRQSQAKFRQELEAAPKPVQDHIYGQIWRLHGEPKGAPNFGRDNLFKDLGHLQIAILSTPGLPEMSLCFALFRATEGADMTMAKRILPLLPKSTQGKIFGAIYEQSFDAQKSKDPHYGEHHVFDKEGSTLAPILSSLMDDFRISELPLFHCGYQYEDDFKTDRKERKRQSADDDYNFGSSARAVPRDEVTDLDTDLGFRLPAGHTARPVDMAAWFADDQEEGTEGAAHQARAERSPLGEKLYSISTDIFGTLGAVEMSDEERSEQVNEILKGHPDIAGKIYGKVWEKAGKPNEADFGKNKVAHDVPRLRAIFDDLIAAS